MLLGNTLNDFTKRDCNYWPLLFSMTFLTPYNKPTTTAIVANPSIGTPLGGTGPLASGGGGMPSPCEKHTKLINTNKIEAKIFLFCILIVA